MNSEQETELRAQLARVTEELRDNRKLRLDLTSDIKTLREERDSWQRRAEAAESALALATPWKLFYGDGLTIGQVAEKLGGNTHDYSPWLIAPLVRTAMQAGEATKASMQADLAAAQALCAKMQGHITCVQACLGSLGLERYPNGRREMEEALAATPSEALAEMLQAAWNECWAIRSKYSQLSDPVSDESRQREYENSETFRRLAGGGAK